MRAVHRKWLTLAAALGFAHWFFGNLYEAVVFSPNWIVGSAAQITRLNEFFVRTSPTTYFVPVLGLATLLTWALHAVAPGGPALSSQRKASLFALLSFGVNAFIVATVVTHLFGMNRAAPEALNGYCWRWNWLNLLRMALVSTTAYHLFAAFRALDRA